MLFLKPAPLFSAKCADWRNPPRTLKLWRRTLQKRGGTLEIWAAQNAGAEFSKVHAAPHSGEMVRTLKSSAAFWRNEPCRVGIVGCIMYSCLKCLKKSKQVSGKKKEAGIHLVDIAAFPVWGWLIFIDSTVY